MAAALSFVDDRTRDDLRVFLERLQRAGEPEVRVSARGTALGVFGCTQAPRGITDTVPVVLVMRAFELAEPAEAGLDTTVQGRALLDRLARGASGPEEDPGTDAGSGTAPDLLLPDVTAMAAWAGVLPPVSGWRAAGSIDAASLRGVAEEGIRRVAEKLPENPGDAVVQRVRSAVWGSEIAPGLPAAAAFAAEAMGFLTGEDRVALTRSLTWTRLTSERGHVLVRSLLG